MPQTRQRDSSFSRSLFLPQTRQRDSSFSRSLFWPQTRQRDGSLSRSLFLPQTRQTPLLRPLAPDPTLRPSRIGLVGKPSSHRLTALPRNPLRRQEGVGTRRVSSRAMMRQRRLLRRRPRRVGRRIQRGGIAGGAIGVQARPRLICEKPVSTRCTQ